MLVHSLAKATQSAQFLNNQSISTNN